MESHLLPVEYLPPDYIGPNNGSVQRLIGQCVWGRGVCAYLWVRVWGKGCVCVSVGACVGGGVCVPGGLEYLPPDSIGPNNGGA